MTLQDPIKNDPGRLFIRQALPNDIPTLARIISLSYQDVAQTFHLTEENCPKHPSNCTIDWVEDDLNRNVTYSLLFKDDIPAGCVALETADREISYLERLAVLPQFRHQGLGKKLVAHVLEQARQTRAKTLGIGIIADQKNLKKWYEALGFTLTGTKRFDHLPFKVGFMHICL